MFVEVDVQDVLDELQDDELIEELEERGYTCRKYTEPRGDTLPEEYAIPRVYMNWELRRHLTDLFGLYSQATDVEIAQRVMDELRR